MTPGPNGTLPDSSLLAPTDTEEWTQISADFPIGFAFYSEVALNQYTGTLATINNGELSISIESTDSLFTTMTVDLPGDAPRFAAIPSADMPTSLQSIGISVETKLLSVIVDCHVINSVWLANMPTHFNFSVVQALNPPTIVRSFLKNNNQ